MTEDCGFSNRAIFSEAAQQSGAGESFWQWIKQET
jgi:hypothetical protein